MATHPDNPDNPEIRALVEIVHSAARELNHAIKSLPAASVNLAAIAELDRFGTLTELVNHVDRVNRVVRDAAAMQAILDDLRSGKTLTHQAGLRGDGYYVGDGIPERLDNRLKVDTHSVNRLIREGYIKEVPSGHEGFKSMITVYALSMPAAIPHRTDK